MYGRAGTASVGWGGSCTGCAATHRHTTRHAATAAARATARIEDRIGRPGMPMPARAPGSRPRPRAAPSSTGRTDCEVAGAGEKSIDGRRGRAVDIDAGLGGGASERCLGLSTPGPNVEHPSSSSLPSPVLWVPQRWVGVLGTG